MARLEPAHNSWKAVRADIAAFSAGEITPRNGERPTRLESPQFSKEHEFTHRQRVFVYLRLNDVAPPTTSRRLAKANV